MQFTLAPSKSKQKILSEKYSHYATSLRATNERAINNLTQTHAPPPPLKISAHPPVDPNVVTLQNATMNLDQNVQKKLQNMSYPDRTPFEEESITMPLTQCNRQMSAMQYPNSSNNSNKEEEPTISDITLNHAHTRPKMSTMQYRDDLSNNHHHIVPDITLNHVQTLNIHKTPRVTRHTHIVNVYQEYYKATGDYAKGLGDFIRGCYFLMTYCDKYSLRFGIDLHHPIQSVTNRGTTLMTKINQQIYNTVGFYQANNLLSTSTNENNEITGHILDSQMFTHFSNYLKNIQSFNGTAFVFTNGFPYIKLLTRTHKNIIRNFFTPCPTMSEKVEHRIAHFKLVKNQYQILHIRCGDDYFINGQKSLPEVLVNKIIQCIEKDTHINTASTLLITDNAFIKKSLKDSFPSLHIINAPISHTGEGTHLTDSQVSATMMDFYLMSLAQSIRSFTTYGHGSGFSQWCAFTYDVPYKCTILS